VTASTRSSQRGKSNLRAELEGSSSYLRFKLPVYRVHSLGAELLSAVKACLTFKRHSPGALCAVLKKASCLHTTQFTPRSNRSTTTAPLAACLPPHPGIEHPPHLRRRQSCSSHPLGIRINTGY
jgi:hypothetical protein